MKTNKALGMLSKNLVSEIVPSDTHTIETVSEHLDSEYCQTPG